jgi:hypothetical protein
MKLEKNTVQKLLFPGWRKSWIAFILGTILTGQERDRIEPENRSDEEKK